MKCTYGELSRVGWDMAISHIFFELQKSNLVFFFRYFTLLFSVPVNYQQNFVDKSVLLTLLSQSLDGVYAPGTYYMLPKYLTNE